MSGPVVILVEPQLPENIGMAARAMANFGLSRLRLVAPREGWPNEAAWAAAVGAAGVLDAAACFPTAREAVADLSFVLATTARARGQMKRVWGPADAAAALRGRIGRGEEVGILFGRERTGLENDDVSLADAILTFPVDPAFASLNVAGAVLLVAYEWARGRDAPLPFEAGPHRPPAAKGALISLFDWLEAELERAGFYPPDKKPVMTRNMRDILHRMAMSEQELRTWRGALRALAQGRPRKG